MAWRHMHWQWEPRSRSRFTSMLLAVLSFKFTGDAQASLESFQKNIREFEAQSGHQIPDFIKAGIVMNGVEERTLRDHLVMHASRLDTFEKIRAEITEIARTRAALGGPTPMELDALKGKGKDKDKGKYDKGDSKGKGKGKGDKSGGKDKTKDIKCFYCGKKGHKKEDCRKRLADLKKAQAEGKPSVINELTDGGHALPQQQQLAIAAALLDRPSSDDVLYLWVCVNASTQEQMLLNGLVLLDSGAAVSACPKSYGTVFVDKPSTRNLNLRAVSGATVEHHGSRTVRRSAGGQEYDIEFEIADVGGPIISFSQMEDAGWSWRSDGSSRSMVRGDESIDVVRSNGVYWVRLGEATGATDVAHLCGTALVEEPVGEKERTVKTKPIPVLPSEATRTTHMCVHCPPRSWCEHCVKGFAMEDPHKRRDKSKHNIPEIQMDYMFVGSASRKDKKDKKDAKGSADQAKENTNSEEEKIICAIHVVDVVSLCRMVMVCNKGLVDHVSKAIVDFLKEVGRSKVVIRSDNEPAIKALVDDVVRNREDETLVEEIPPGNSQTVGTVEHGNYQVGCQIRALRSSVEARLGITLVPGMAAIAWLFRHAAWIMNRFGIGRDGCTPFERYRGKGYHGEVCELFEMVYWVVPASKEHKFDSRTSTGLWLGKTSKGDSHLIFNEEVIQARTVKRMVEERRWRAQVVKDLDALPWMPRPPRVQERVATRRRRYITWNLIKKYGGTPGCSACSVDGSVHSKKCVERFQAIFEEEETKVAAQATAERMQRDKEADKEAGLRGESPPVVGSSSGAASSSEQKAPQEAQQQQRDEDTSMDLEVATQVMQQSVGGASRKADVVNIDQDGTRSTKKVRTVTDTVALLPERRGETRDISDVPSPSTVPESKRQRELAGLAVCALTVIGSSFDTDDAYDEPDVPRGASTQEATQDEEYDVPTLIAQTPTKDVYGTRSGELLQPEQVQKGRQRELDSLMRHRVVEEVPNGGDGKHVQAGWVEDYKPYPEVRSRFVAKQIAYGQREDVTQSTPALLVFRLLLALAACGFVGGEACFAVFDISVAFLHSVMDEVVFVHPPRGEGLVRPGFCWRLRKAMYGTRRASRLWADKVKLVLENAGCKVLRTMSMVFWHPDLRFVLAVWGDDFGTIGSKDAIDSLEKILTDAFECKNIGVVGPQQGTRVKLLNRVIAWSPRGFRWHTDPKHARVVCEGVGLTPGESKAAGTPGTKGAP